MKSLLTPSRRTHCSLEPLEARIAPATVYIGAIGNNESNLDTEYTDSPTHETRNTGDRPVAFAQRNFVDIVASHAVNPNDLIASALVGTGATALTEVGKYYYLHLYAGDEVLQFTQSANYKPLIDVSSGEVIAVFTDFVTANGGAADFNDGELTGLVLGAGAGVQIHGSVNGDIVTALDTHGNTNPADDSLDLSGLGSSKTSINNLQVLGGSVFGSVLAGGNITGLLVATNVDSVAAGTAVNGHTFDLVKVQTRVNGQPIFDPNGNPIFNSPRFTPNFTEPSGQTGSSISFVSVGAIGRDAQNPLDPAYQTALGNGPFEIAAGAGGFGAKGGSLSYIAVTGDSDGFALHAGAGGPVSGFAASGGAGGDISYVAVYGTSDGTPNSASANGLVQGIQIVAGAGGGDIANAAVGGAGGNITNVLVGFDSTGAQSSNVLSDSVHLLAGAGGDGAFAGAGGYVYGVKVVVSTPDGLGDEIEVGGGKGGASAYTSGSDGAGGGIAYVDARNIFAPAVAIGSVPPIIHSSINFHAGDAGDNALNNPAGAAGAAGGGDAYLAILGFDSTITAGSGSEGSRGGAGGGVAYINNMNSDAVTPHNFTVNTGHGGLGHQFDGGAGGSLYGIISPVSDFQSFHINSLATAGLGGDSQQAHGGAGGGVYALDIQDQDTATGQAVPISGDVVIHGGSGGSGALGGGAGGVLAQVRVSGAHLSLEGKSGSGGSATVFGAGGIGGTITSTFLEGVGPLFSTDLNNAVVTINPTGVLIAGDGGAGAGAGGTGGSGGSVLTASVRNDGDSTLRAGSGGSGQNTVGATVGGASGSGGSIISSGLVSQFGFGDLEAGSAGVGGAAAGYGGSIQGATSVTAADEIDGVRAATSITIKSGSGAHGGSGGNISAVAFEGADGFTAPTGAITIQAGNGSFQGATAGQGGTILNVIGSVSSGPNQLTRLTAGDGGGGAGAGAGGAGGSIVNLTISGGGGLNSVLVLEGGNAGNSTASTGATGGSVSNVGITGLAAGTIFRSVASGNGGDGSAHGGAAGNITTLFVQNNDIGIKTGQTFGYNTQGGIFAGVGGNGTVHGVNGAVQYVTANSISSIVAGARPTAANPNPAPNDPILIPHLASSVSYVAVSGTTKDLLLAANNVFSADGDFQLSFNGVTTPLLAAHSSAQQVQNALNALKPISDAGGVTVGYSLAGGYVVTFNQPGNQNQIGSVEIISSNVVQSTAAGTTPIPVTTPVEGILSLNVAEIRSGNAPIGISVIHAGSNSFAGAETVAGDATHHESQVLDISQLNGSSVNQFQLSYGASTTANIPANASAATIQTALNNLQDINDQGSVDVTAVPNTVNHFQVTFRQAGPQTAIIGQTFVREVERVDLAALTPNSGNLFSLSFNNSSTANIAYSGSLSSIAASIQTALNALPTVKATGPNNSGSVVVAPVFGSSTAFDITFQPVGTQSLVVGAAQVFETQKINLPNEGANSTDTFVVRAGNMALPGNPALPGDQVTAPLSVNATAEEVQNAINGLPAIMAEGGVTVVKAADGFSITFNTLGDKPPLGSSLLRHEQQTIDLSQATGPSTDLVFHLEHTINVAETTHGSNTAKEVQGVDLGSLQAYTNGLYTLSFNGAHTTILPAMASATSIQTALNALPTVKALGPNGSGAVTVTQTGAGIFSIAFNVNGDQPLVSGSGAVYADRFPISVTQTTHGAPAIIVVSEKNSGASTNAPVSELTKGGAAQDETQRIDVTKASNNGDFTLQFGTDSTTNFAYGTPAATVQAALNKLGTVQGLAPNGTGSVSVTYDNAGHYNVTFNETGDQISLVAPERTPEQQQVSLGSIANSPTGQFNLSFQNQVTGSLPANATASQVQTALEGLTSIQNAGDVVVTGNAGGPYVITFQKLGADPLIAAEGGAAHSQQRLNLGALQGTGGSFELNFNGQTTAPISEAGGAAAIQSALNNLTSVKETRSGASGAVTVALDPSGLFYTIDFNGVQDLPTISGMSLATMDRQLPTAVIGSDGTSASFNGSITTFTQGSSTVKEVQRVDLSNLSANQQYQLSFDDNTNDANPGYTSPLFSKSTPLTTIQAQLNALPSIQAAGGIASVAADGPSAYKITFTGTGDKTQITGVIGTHEQQSFDPLALAKFQVPVTTVNGTGNSPEQDTIDLTGVNSEIYLQINGFRTATIPVANVAPATLKTNIQNAVNALGQGNVTVTQGAAANTYVITFNANGDQPALTGGADFSDGLFHLTFGTDTTRAIHVGATALEVQNALNALPGIKALQPHDQGNVTVTLQNGQYLINYNVVGDQPTVVATGAVAVNPTLDIFRTHDGSTGSNVALGVSETTKGSTIGPAITEFQPGGGDVLETQSLDISQFVASGDPFTLTFNAQDPQNAQTTVSINPASPTVAADIQNALNSLPGINQQGGGNGQVAVTGTGANQYNISFNVAADEPALVANDTTDPSIQVDTTETTKGSTRQPEIELLNLQHVNNGSSTFVVAFGSDSATVNIGANSSITKTNIQNALNSLPSVQASDGSGNGTGMVVVGDNGDGTFNLTFNSNGKQQLIAATQFPTSVTDGSASSSELQEVDVSTLLPVSGSTFQLTYNNQTTPVPLSPFSTPSQVQSALNALSSISAVGGVTVSSPNEGIYDVTFNMTGNQPGLVIASGGDEEVQHIDTTLLQQPGNSSFQLSFGTSTTPALPENSSAASVQTALNNLLSIKQAGGVTVTQTTNAGGVSGYDVTFGSFADQPSIQANVNVYEQQMIDLHTIASPTTGGEEFIQFSYAGSKTPLLPANSTPITIATALNNLPGILAAGGVAVSQTTPSEFVVSFNRGGPRSIISGTVDPFGTTERLPDNATPVQLEAALDRISISDVTLTAGAKPGTFTATFGENGNQPLLQATANSHEQQLVDVLDTGAFSLSLGTDSTGLLQIDPATGQLPPADQIRAALNALPAIQAEGGVRDVTVDQVGSAFTITYNSDANVPELVLHQNLQNVPVSTLTQGAAGIPGTQEVQEIDYVPLGAFDAAKFQSSHIVGAIVDFNEINSNQFHFLKPDPANPGQFIPTVATANNPFVEGDIPIDGIVMAQVIDQTTTNFIPEARLTANGFFDNLNR